MGKSTISMAIFNSYVNLPEGIHDPSAVVGLPYFTTGFFHGKSPH